MFFGYLRIPSFPFKKFFDSSVNGRRYLGGLEVDQKRLRGRNGLSRVAVKN